MTANEKARVVFFLPSLEYGGAERNTVNLLKNLDRQHFIPSLLLAQKKGVFLKNIPSDVVITDLNTTSLFVLMMRLVIYFRREKLHVFISTFPRFNFVNVLAKILSGKNVKIVIIEQTTPSNLFVTAKKTIHKLVARFFLSHLMDIFYPKAQAIVCVSKAVKEDLVKFTHTQSILEKTRVIYNPVAEDTIVELSKENIDHPWFKDKDVPVILAVGRIVKAKDYPTLLGALSLIIKEKMVRLVILGKGEAEEDVKKLAENLGILQNIDFLQWQENPYKYMAKASVFVNSSLREGFSNAIIEAMACGVPIVATDCVGPREIIENNKSGILVPVGDETSLANAITSILNTPSLSENLSQEGKRRAQDFTIQKSVQNYQTLLGQLL